MSESNSRRKKDRVIRSNNDFINQTFNQLQTRSSSMMRTIYQNVRILLHFFTSMMPMLQQKQQKQKGHPFTLMMIGQQHESIRSSAMMKIVVSIALLVMTPFVVYARFPGSDLKTFLLHIVIGWDSLLHFSVYPIIATTALAALYLEYVCKYSVRGSCLKAKNRSASCSACFNKSSVSNNNNDRDNTSNISIPPCWRHRPVFVCFIIIYAFNVAACSTSILQMIAPSWMWNPFLWAGYRVYTPDEILPAMDGICIDRDDNNKNNQDPLCLSEKSWKVLSSGGLSSQNKDDVDNVLKGLQYAQNQSGGIIFNIMARDTVDAIEPLRYNVEGLVPFFRNKLAVVVFENDSKDGTREAFKEWALDANGYTVDVMSCGETNPDCKFGLSHRYDATEAKDYFKSSAIGKMAEFRQRMADYITTDTKYKDYSHMIVMDLDLEISISPLGILHSLGKVPDSAIASSARQTWPGSCGSLVPPYDLSAFRAIETPYNRNLMQLHEKFCELMPPGDRWRNQCDAASPMQLMLVLSHDWMSGNEPYQVASAFNGATLYPIQLIKGTNAKYDIGDDGQRCEHIGFNMGLQQPMYVNPKWAMNISPENPGGPTGWRALKNVVRIMITPRLSLTMFFQNMGCIGILVFSTMVLSLQIWNILSMMSERYHRIRRKLQVETELPLLDRSSDDETEEEEEEMSPSSRPVRRRTTFAVRTGMTKFIDEL